MTEEKLEFANNLKRKMMVLDKEIDRLFDILPPTRDNLKKRRGICRKIFGNKLIPKEGLNIEIELSNEDIRALIDIRSAELNALRQVLEALE